MQHQLFSEINKFRQWATNIPEEKKSGEWECDYDEYGWRAIYTNFNNFLITSNSKDWNNDIINELLYIIARDNELEELAKIVGKNPPILIILAKAAITMGEKDSKWQLVVQLVQLADKKLAENLLEEFVQDTSEYVRRRALIALADINSPKTEYYAKLAWDWDIDHKLQEYQKKAALYALDKINSPLLERYVQLAKQDGRKFLLQDTILIEEKS